jgi:hypothetical protein
MYKVLIRSTYCGTIHTVVTEFSTMQAADTACTLLNSAEYSNETTALKLFKSIEESAEVHEASEPSEDYGMDVQSDLAFDAARERGR